MLQMIAMSMLAAAPVVVVAPFEVTSPESADDDLGLAMQNLVVHELAAVGITSRTEDVDVKDYGKTQGATHVVVGAVMRVGPQFVVSARLIDTRDNNLLTTVKMKGPTVWNDRRQLTSAVLEALKLPMPARPDGYDVNEELARAWGAALRALKSGDPKVAKDKVSAVVAKWPKFMPAKAQLAKL